MADNPSLNPDEKVEIGKISSLGPTELAFRAGRLFVDVGMCREVFLMLYRAIELDAYHVEAHETLSGVLADFGWPELSCALCEFLLEPGRPLTPRERQHIENKRFFHIYMFGFARRPDGASSASFGELEDPSAFVVDQAAYASLLEELFARTGTLEGAYRSALTVAGFVGGALAHISGADPVPNREFFRPERFVRKPGTPRGWTPR